MDREKTSSPISLKRIHMEDAFWKQEMELVRTEVIPYQWETLNDRVEDAAPSYCMHNFRVAAKMRREKERRGSAYQEPQYTYRGFESLPEDPRHPDDKFYGFVFQDSDFSKWIEAVAYSLTQHPDEELERIADGAVDIVCAAQQPNGYLDTYYIINGMDKIFTNLKDHHELYCFGHLTEGAIAYYQATGKDKLLKAAMAYADFIDSWFGPGKDQCKGYPGHEIAEMALVRLYELTGEERYLKLAEFFLNERGTKPYYFDREVQPGAAAQKKDLRYVYYQSHLPVRQQQEAVGHAVRAVYLYSGMADVARITKDEQLLKACETIWNNITRKQMYITGGIGQTAQGEAFTYAYDLPNDTAYSETCAAIGLVFFARRMLEIKPDSRYADVMELALHNGVLSGMALDGRSFFYVNPLSVYPESCRRDPRKEHVKPVRQKWFGCACCPPNLARLISSVGSYAFTENEDTVWIHLYAGASVEKEVCGKRVTLQLTSGLPWKGEAAVSVRGEEPVEMTVALRIPGWCGEDFEITGAMGKQCRMEDGYMYISGLWEKEDKVQVRFGMKVKLLQADSRVRQDEGRLAVMRGPVVYCLEEADNGRDLPLIRLRPREAFTEEFTQELGTPMVMLRTRGRKRRPCQTETEGLYREFVKPEYEERELRFIPYYAWANRGEGEMEVWVNYQ